MFHYMSAGRAAVYGPAWAAGLAAILVLRLWGRRR